jgi:hypothetical protein
MSGPGWRLPSNRGDRVASWEVLRCADEAADGDPVLTCRFEFKALSYSWEKPPGSEPETDPDFILTLSDLKVRSSVLARFEWYLRAWLDLPVDEQARTVLYTSSELNGRYEEFLRLTFSPREDTISDGHPVATFSYRHAFVEGELRYVADQSCVRILADGIRDALAALSSGRL